MHINDVNTNTYGRLADVVVTNNKSPNVLRRPPLFQLGNVSTEDLRSYTLHAALSLHERDLICAVFDLCALDPDRTCSIDELAVRVGEGTKRGIKGAGILRRASRLVKLGIFQKAEVRVAGKKGRPAVTYILQAADKLSIPSIRSSPMIQLDLLDTAAFLDALWNPDNPRIDDYWCEFISPVLPLEDRTVTKEIVSTIHYSGEEIPIRVTAREGSRIPTIRSIKTVVAVFTLVEAIIRHRRNYNESSSTRFVVDISDVLKIMRLANEGGNRRTVVQHLKEWESALFEFPELTTLMKQLLSDRFGAESFGFSHHQLVSQLKGVGVMRDGQKIPTHLSFEVPVDFVRRIESDGVYNMFTITPAFMAENNPIALAFHLYCRKNLSHRKDRPLNVTYKTLHQRIAKGISYREFRKRFDGMLNTKVIERNDDPEYQRQMRELIDSETKIFKQVTVLGYTVTLNGEGIIVRPDPDDPYVGLASKHALLKQKTEIELANKAEADYKREHGEKYTDRK